MAFFDVAQSVMKNLDVNRYATKKTIAQGLVDIALLSANACQLKYVLQVGKQHEFYSLMLTLICLSIILQIANGIVCVLLGSTCNLNKEVDHSKSELWNNVNLILMGLTVAVNTFISAFDMSDTSTLFRANSTSVNSIAATSAFPSPVIPNPSPAAVGL